MKATSFEIKWYILGKNSQFEVCPTVSLDIKDISDFGKDIVSEAGSDSNGISSHDSSKSDTESDYNTELSIISTICSSFNRKELKLCFIQAIVIVKLIIIIRWLEIIFE